MRFKEKDMQKMIETQGRTTIKHFNLKVLVVLFVVFQ